ncbi:hypothetical protein V8E54_000987 [Elaphomyces granulatus]
MSDSLRFRQSDLSNNRGARLKSYDYKHVGDQTIRAIETTMFWPLIMPNGGWRYQSYSAESASKNHLGRAYDSPLYIHVNKGHGQSVHAKSQSSLIGIYLGRCGALWEILPTLEWLMISGIKCAAWVAEREIWIDFDRPQSFDPGHVTEQQYEWMESKNELVADIGVYMEADSLEDDYLGKQNLSSC